MIWLIWLENLMVNLSSNKLNLFWMSGLMVGITWSVMDGNGASETFCSIHLSMFVLFFGYWGDSDKNNNHCNSFLIPVLLTFSLITIFSLHMLEDKQLWKLCHHWMIAPFSMKLWNTAPCWTKQKKDLYSPVWNTIHYGPAWVDWWSQVLLMGFWHVIHQNCRLISVVLYLKELYKFIFSIWSKKQLK